MMTEDDVLCLLRMMESDRIERTESTSNTDKFSQAVCAFANDLPNHAEPGYLLVGARDNGTLAGMRIDDQTLQNLAALRSNGNIQPLPSLTVCRYAFEQGDLAVVTVMPSDFPPVRYKGQVWIRIGPRKGVATEQEERALTEKRLTHARSFDASAQRAATLDDLALSLFTVYRQQVVSPDVIEANHRSVEDQLASLRFFDPRQSCPTHAGLLLFGKNPRFFLPGAYIQFLRIAGTHLTDPITDQAELSGDLRSLLHELELRIRVNLQARLLPTGLLSEKQAHDYPERALRELLMNAVMHRDYQSNAPVKCYWFSDRIEIHSPGGLYGVVTPETLETASDYRNPVIAEAMKALGFVNRFGYGIQQAQRSLRENGNPPAEFVCQGHTVLAILRKAAA